MVTIFRQLILLLSLCGIAFNVAHAADKNNFYRNFWNPTFHTERLNYCTMDGQKCGLPVASLYCKMMGYQYADKQIIAKNVGLTHFILTKSQCKGWECNGFKLIRCVGEMNHKPPAKYHYRAVKFPFPRFGNYRIDWCYEGSKGCGARAANSFCRRVGYANAVKFEKQEHVAATKALSDQKLCFGNQCSSFSFIDCYR